MAKSMRWARKMGEKYWQSKIEKKIKTGKDFWAAEN
jgi:hypothetical protein